MTRIGSTAYVGLILDLSLSVVRISAFIAFHGTGIAQSVRHVGTARQSGWDVAACFLSSCKRVQRSRVPKFGGSLPPLVVHRVAGDLAARQKPSNKLPA